MMRRGFASAALAAILAVMASLQAESRAVASQETAGYKDVSPEELAALLAQEDPFLLDVHVPHEGYLAGTDARIPHTDVAARAAELPQDPDARIVVYCMSGRMGEIASAELVRLGYRNVLNLTGGMIAWGVADYEILLE